MTNEDIAAATRKKLAEVLPDLLQATLKEYKEYLDKPTSSDEKPTFSQKQSSGKAAASHVILLFKLLNEAGLQDLAKRSEENLSEILLKATQEYEKFKSLENSNKFDDDE